MNRTLLHIVCYLFPYRNHLTSSKTILNQCVSTGCRTFVSKSKISIDNQHVTNIIGKVYISPPKQPKENT